MDEIHKRRLSHRTAKKIAEANVFLQLAKSILDKESIDPGLDAIIKQISQLEQKHLLISDGKIESRERFKRHATGHPFLNSRLTSQLFIDESGKSHKSNQHVFVLSGIAMYEADITAYCDQANLIKQKYFGSSAITFHEPHMRKRDGIYRFSNDVEWQEFDTELTQLLEATPFTVFGVAIRIDKIQDYYLSTDQENFLPADLYHCAILLMLERYIDFLASSKIPLFGKLIFESQGPKEDVDHQYAYASLLKEGTQWVPESAFRSHLYPGVDFVPKKGSHPTEIADMFARDLFEWVSSGCRVEPPKWELFSNKIYLREDAKHGKFGVKVFPDSDIRELIEEHRQKVFRIKQKSANSQGE